MFARVATVFTWLFFILPLLASAIAIEARGGGSGGGGDPNPCNNGPAQCCNSLQSASSATVSGLFSLLNITSGSATGQVGVTCNPITAIGVEDNSCSSQVVCCTNENFNGIVALGCTPINANV